MITVAPAAADSETESAPTEKRKRGRPKKDVAVLNSAPAAAMEQAIFGAMAFDIETGPQEESIVLAAAKPFVEPFSPGQFDPSSVKLGNLKDQGKIDEKIAQAAAAHQYQIDNFQAIRDASYAAWRFEAMDKAPLDPTIGRVVAIGYCYAIDGAETRICDTFDEEKIIKQIWQVIQDALAKRLLILGFNSNSFDLPFLIQRSWILGIPVPAGIRHGRFWNDLCVDLMNVWCCYAYGERIKLEKVAQALGLEGKKKEISGKDFHKYWKPDADPLMKDLADGYLRQDVKLVLQVAERMGVI